MSEKEEQYQLLLEDKEALKQIRAKFNIDEPRFLMGLTYVGLTLDGNLSKTRAYSQAFDTDGETAAKVSAQFHRAKWIQALISYLRPEGDSLYLSEIKTIIGTGMGIIHSNQSTHREKIDAMKALQPYIKAEKKMVDLSEGTAETVGMSIVTQLERKINDLVMAGKMVNEMGEIIDVVAIE